MGELLEVLEGTNDRDCELAECARGGSREAFDALFQRHKLFVYNVCYRMLGSSEDAVDAMQTAFIQAYNGLPGFRGRSAFRSWLYRIAVNVSTSLIRQKQRRAALERQADIPQEAAETDDSVWQAVLMLPPNYRSVIVLFYFQGLSLEEAAAALGCSKVTVATRLHRARAALRQKIEEAEQ